MTFTSTGEWIVINGFDGIVTADVVDGEFSLSGEGNINFHTISHLKTSKGIKVFFILASCFTAEYKRVSR